jgi:hypothetical protein
LRVLFDHNVDRRFRRCLSGHDIKTTRERGWEDLDNGKLLAAAAGGGFEVFLSIDKRIRFEQNLDKLPLPIIVIDSVSNALPALIPFAPHVLALLNTPLLKIFHLLASDGSVRRFGTPRGDQP